MFSCSNEELQTEQVAAPESSANLSRMGCPAVYAGLGTISSTSRSVTINTGVPHSSGSYNFSGTTGSVNGSFTGASIWSNGQFWMLSFTIPQSKSGVYCYNFTRTATNSFTLDQCSQTFTGCVNYSAFTINLPEPTIEAEELDEP